ncbi:MAG: metallophosphoesterase family protein [Planctomycetales bacterium]
MRLAVVSDTHGQLAYTAAAVKLISSHGAQVVLHCGDIGSTDIVPLFAEWPTHFVFGNVDYDTAELSQAIHEAGQTCHDRFGTLQLEGTEIAFLHSDDQSRFQATIDSGEYDLVCYGHTHVPRQHRVGKTLVLNPGALFRATPHTIALVELPALEVQHITVA